MEEPRISSGGEKRRKLPLRGGGGGLSTAIGKGFPKLICASLKEPLGNFGKVLLIIYLNAKVVQQEQCFSAFNNSLA
jgi:hypothetical protein